jgi:hypothetical protein
MSLFGKLIKTGFNILELPLAVGKDVITLGGTSTEQKQTYTRQLVEKIKEDAE